MTLAGLLLAAALTAQAPDTATYADLATLELMQRARERHRAQDTLVHDYTARVHTRMEVRAGRSRFARLLPLWVHETDARVAWQHPNLLTMRVEGVRARSAFPGVEARVAFNSPWFVPRALGDSVRLMGIPETAALHPLASDAEATYRFAIVDSSTIRVLGRAVDAVAVRVTPRRLAPSVVAGDMWLDRATGDVVRLSVTFLGEFLWSTPDEPTAEDSAQARTGNRWAQRFLTVQADLEYSLVDGRYWMPWRQVLAITASINFIISGAMPARIHTTFSDYEVNGGAPVVFAFAPDSGESRREIVHVPGDSTGLSRDSARATYGFTRTGESAAMRWEITVPPRGTLLSHAWDEPLDIQISEADRRRVEQFLDDIERLEEHLPDEWVMRPRVTLALERIPDIVSYNRVQGVALGWGLAIRPGPAFSTLRVQGRLGLADLRPTGSVAWRREAPEGRLEIAAYRRVADVEPWTRGQSFGNSLNALLAGHDDADYFLGLGGGVSWEFYRGPFAGFLIAAGAERQRSMATEAGSVPNPTIAEGDWVTASLARRLGGPLRGRIGVEGMTGRAGQGGRGFIDARVPFAILRRTGALTVRAGAGIGDPLPQLAYRLGGPHTVRGYPYGFALAREFWSAQLDVAITRNWLIAPVVFVDAGGTDLAREPLAGVGGGISLFGGWLRANLSKGLNPAADVRFDLLFGAPR